jgi:putative glutamine amidotransferase
MANSRAETRPVIGINVDLVNASKTAGAYIRLAAGYFDKIYEAKGLPILLPPLNKDEALDELLDKVDGVILCGGGDLDPKRQNLPTHSTVVPMSARREENDFALLRKIMDRQMPVLGIGVGMQQINVAHGGTLLLHLPEDMPKSFPHYDPTGGPHRHIVNLEPKSRLEDIYGEGEIRVNSSHHQAVKKLGMNLRVSAKSPDEVIEAIESTDPDWYCVGVQWHPESETASALDMQLFESFIESMRPVAPAKLRLAA